MDSNEEVLKSIGISFKNSKALEEYYHKKPGLFLQTLPNLQGLYVDLNALPAEPFNFKLVVIKWIIAVNWNRITSGLDPILDFDLVMKCPVWKIYKAPVRRMKMTKEGMFDGMIGKGTSGTIGKSGKAGSINKRK